MSEPRPFPVSHHVQHLGFPNQGAEAEEPPLVWEHHSFPWQRGVGTALGLLVFRGCRGKAATMHDFCITLVHQRSVLRLEQLEKELFIRKNKCL